MSASSRRLLFLSPVMPKPGGNGLAMRAAWMLDALARDFAVDLFVFPVAGPVEEAGAFVEQRVGRLGKADPFGYLDGQTRLALRFGTTDQRRRALAIHDRPMLSLPCTEAAARHIADWAGSCDYAVVHAMRLYLAPLLHAFAGKAALVLDLDDDDAAYEDGLAAYRRAAGDADGAQLATEEAQRYRSFSATWIPRLNLCLTAGADDANRLGGAFPGTSIRAVPNAYPVLEPRPLPSAASDLLRLLFVGNLRYPPNADAAAVLIRDVLPRLQAQVPIRLDIVGAGPAALAPLAAGNPSLILHDFVEELAPLYAAADIAVAPLRFGAGTPIKLLEAFAYERPVVATGFAASGHQLIDGQHLLLADDADGFAAACLRLHRDGGLRQRLTATAGKRLRAQHHPERMAEMLKAAYATLKVE